MRIFKIKWFTRETSSHGTSDDELCQTTQSAFQGKMVDLRGGVYKKRLNKNRNRAIIPTRSVGHWSYTFLYTKQDMIDINHRELIGFHELVKRYVNLSEERTTVLVKSKELVEVCSGSKK